MTPGVLVLTMSSLEWMTIGLLVFIFGGIFLAFFLYLRTAYKSGGWTRVRRDLLIAMIALAAWAVKKFISNYEMGEIPETIKHLFP